MRSHGLAYQGQSAVSYSKTGTNALWNRSLPGFEKDIGCSCSGMSDEEQALLFPFTWGQVLREWYAVMEKRLSGLKDCGEKKNE